MTHRTLALTLIAFALTGCGDKSTDPRPPAGAPVWSTPVAAANAVASIWSSRDDTHYAALLTEDFRFVFAPDDTLGATPWSREDERIATGNVFRGTGTQPAASTVTVSFDPNLTSFGDTRPGKNPIWHRTVLTRVNMQVVAGANTYTVGGYHQFYLVRGDSAAIPPDQVVAGVGPDSTRWWLERWEEQGDFIPLRSMPAETFSWWALKHLYR